MRLKKVRGADEKVTASDFVIHDTKGHKGEWKEVFGNDHPIYLEIGMGKGKFITTLSKQNPDINYLGIERYESVLIRAVEKREADEERFPNCYFLCEDAGEILDIFDEHEVSRIYLNFSDPWPKARHAKRRLTSRQYLVKYDKVLKADGEVIFKTDNKDLFDFSVEEMKEAGWTLEFVTYDLHSSERAEGNVMTEYEERFSALGNKICCLVAKR